MHHLVQSSSVIGSHSVASRFPQIPSKLQPSQQTAAVAQYSNNTPDLINSAGPGPQGGRFDGLHRVEQLEDIVSTLIKKVDQLTRINAHSENKIKHLEDQYHAQRGAKVMWNHQNN